MADNLKLLSEQVEIKPGRVDAENGILYDCLLLGPNSRNQVVYPNETREKALPLFKTAKINLGHPSVPSGSEKDRLRAMAQPVHPTSRYGKVLDARNTPEGIRGDVRVGKSHEFTKMLMEAAQDMPELFGFSPLMLGLMAPQRDAEGREVCLEIRKLRSIDLVTDPGTTRGLWEEEAPPETTSEAELKEEAAPEVEEEVPPQEEEALRQSILAEIQAFLDDQQDADETSGRVGKHLKHHSKMYGKDKGKEEDAPEEGKGAAAEVTQEEVRWDLLTRKKGEKVLAEEEKPAKPAVTTKKPKSGITAPAGNGPGKDTDWGKFLRS